MAHASGRIGDALIAAAVATTARRTQHQAFAWCSDGWQGYRQILTRQYRRPLLMGYRGRPRRVMPDAVQLTQTIKHRDAQGHLVSVETRATLGDLVPAPGTIHVERFNGILRDHLNALTRKTHAFAKRDATWDALVSLAVWEHNWLRGHPALRRALGPHQFQPCSPAMALGVTETVWSWTAFLTTSIPVIPS